MNIIVETIVEFLVEVIKFILWYIFWSIVFFNLGRAFLLIFTLGKYPRGEKLETHANFISSMGFFVLFLAWSSIAIYNHWEIIVGSAT
jgi:hypothetical protein